MKNIYEEVMKSVLYGKTVLEVAKGKAQQHKQ